MHNDDEWGILRVFTSALARIYCGQRDNGVGSKRNLVLCASENA
jgi:hypothetical protein